MEASQKRGERSVARPDLLIIPKNKEKHLDLGRLGQLSLKIWSLFLARASLGSRSGLACLEAATAVNREGRCRPSCRGINEVLSSVWNSAVCSGNVERYMSSLLNRSDSSIQTKETDASWFNGVSLSRRFWHEGIHVHEETTETSRLSIRSAHNEPRWWRDGTGTRPSARGTLIRKKRRNVAVLKWVFFTLRYALLHTSQSSGGLLVSSTFSWNHLRMY